MVLKGAFSELTVQGNLVQRCAPIRRIRMIPQLKAILDDTKLAVDPHLRLELVVREGSANGGDCRSSSPENPQKIHRPENASWTEA